MEDLFVECVVILGVCSSKEFAVLDAVEGKGVFVVITRVGVEVSDPGGYGGGLDVNTALGGLGRESCLGHRERMELAYDLGED